MSSPGTCESCCPPRPLKVTEQQTRTRICVCWNLTTSADPTSFENVRKDLEDHIMPGVTHWQSPNFFAYFPANSSYPGILGDMVSSMINCIGFNWICSPACTELETIVLDWMARLLELPEKFLSSGVGGGVIQGTASEAIMLCMLSARFRTFAKHTGIDQGILNSKLVAYVSTQVRIIKTYRRQ